MSALVRMGRITVHAAIATASALSPKLGARIAYCVFLRVGPRLAVGAAQAATHASARRGTITANGRTVVSYEWGAGERTVLLVHGWRGRAAQFSTLVRELRAEGFRVVAFDAPANGDSPGRRTTLLDYIAAIHRLDELYGGFHAIVGHSFGVLASFVAAAEGARTRSIVGVAGASSIDYLCAEFARIAGLSAATDSALRQRFVNRVFGGHSDSWRRYSGLGNPGPSRFPLLLIHDEADKVIDVGQSRLLATAHDTSARLVTTEGLGHSRILSSDELLDEVLHFVHAIPDAHP